MPPSTRILVADDDRALRDALVRDLTVEGYEVDAVGDGADALRRARGGSNDALVLDLGMPGLDGLEVCRALRGEGDRTPILVLTARDGVGDRIAGLDAGADDYLVKPFDLGELEARLRALLRRAGDAGDATATTSFGELELDPGARAVRVSGTAVELTRTEYALLEVLMRNPGRVLAHGLIYDRVWQYDFGPGSNALRVYIGYLRRKLEDAGARRLIQTVRGVGYVLREP